VKDRLGLFCNNIRELNHIINNHLPGCLPFQHEEISIAGSTFDFYYCDILQCIRTLYEDPNFMQHLVFAPERHYTDETKTA
jgi:hypothetical protein